MIPHQPGPPRYRPEQVIVDQTGRRYLVLHVGIEAYFVRWLNPPIPSGPDEPREPIENAWGHEGCEDATEPEERP